MFLAEAVLWKGNGRITKQPSLNPSAFKLCHRTVLGPRQAWGMTQSQERRASRAKALAVSSDLNF